MLKFAKVAFAIVITLLVHWVATHTQWYVGIAPLGHQLILAGVAMIVAWLLVMDERKPPSFDDLAIRVRGAFAADVRAVNSRLDALDAKLSAPPVHVAPAAPAVPFSADMLVQMAGALEMILAKYSREDIESVLALIMNSAVAMQQIGDSDAEVHAERLVQLLNALLDKAQKLPGVLVMEDSLKRFKLIPQLQQAQTALLPQLPVMPLERRKEVLVEAAIQVQDDAFDGNHKAALQRVFARFDLLTANEHWPAEVLNSKGRADLLDWAEETLRDNVDDQFYDRPAMEANPLCEQVLHKLLRAKLAA